MWWLFSSPVSFSSPFRCSSSRPSRCLPPSSTRSSKSKDLRDFRLGTVASSDHETPLTGYEPNRDMNFVDTEELDLAATSDIYWQHTLDDNTSRNDPDVDDDQLAMYLAGVVDSTGKPVAQRSSKGQFSWDTRNLSDPWTADSSLRSPTGGVEGLYPYTSYLRTNDCTNNGYVTDNLEHNTMINIDTVAHMILHYTQS